MGKTPKADPGIAIAANKSADTGQAMLDFMKTQAATTNQWAAEDRNRYKTTFEPLQDAYIKEAQDFASPDRVQAAADTARADVALAADAANGTRARQAMAMGVNPMSGRFADAGAKAATATALASAGGANIARRTVEDQGRSMKANAINLGSGLAINPGTSMGLSNGGMSAGTSAAMSGYGQQGSLLNADYQNRMTAYNASSGLAGSIGSALGSVAGMIPEAGWAALFASSKEIKENKQPVPDALGVLNSMPVEKWDYKPGAGDGGTHIGPYAEDFQAATGLGDGKSIDALSMIGVTMGAVQDLSKQVNELKAAMGAPMAMGVNTGRKKPAQPARMAA